MDQKFQSSMNVLSCSLACIRKRLDIMRVGNKVISTDILHTAYKILYTTAICIAIGTPEGIYYKAETRRLLDVVSPAGALVQKQLKYLIYYSLHSATTDEANCIFPYTSWDESKDSAEVTFHFGLLPYRIVDSKHLVLDMSVKTEMPLIEPRLTEEAAEYFIENKKEEGDMKTTYVINKPTQKFECAKAHTNKPDLLGAVVVGCLVFSDEAVKDHSGDEAMQEAIKIGMAFFGFKDNTEASHSEPTYESSARTFRKTPVNTFTHMTAQVTNPAVNVPKSFNTDQEVNTSKQLKDDFGYSVDPIMDGICHADLSVLLCPSILYESISTVGLCSNSKKKLEVYKKGIFTYAQVTIGVFGLLFVEQKMDHAYGFQALFESKDSTMRRDRFRQKVEEKKSELISACFSTCLDIKTGRHRHEADIERYNSEVDRCITALLNPDNEPHFIQSVKDLSKVLNDIKILTETFRSEAQELFHGILGHNEIRLPPQPAASNPPVRHDKSAVLHMFETIDTSVAVWDQHTLSFVEAPKSSKVKPPIEIPTTDQSTQLASKHSHIANNMLRWLKEERHDREDYLKVYSGNLFFGLDINGTYKKFTKSVFTSSYLRFFNLDCHNIYIYIFSLLYHESPMFGKLASQVSPGETFSKANLSNIRKYFIGLVFSDHVVPPAVRSLTKAEKKAKVAEIAERYQQLSNSESNSESNNGEAHQPPAANNGEAPRPVFKHAISVFKPALNDTRGNPIQKGSIYILTDIGGDRRQYVALCSSISPLPKFFFGKSNVGIEKHDLYINITNDSLVPHKSYSCTPTPYIYSGNVDELNSESGRTPLISRYSQSSTAHQPRAAAQKIALQPPASAQGEAFAAAAAQNFARQPPASAQGEAFAAAAAQNFARLTPAQRRMRAKEAKENARLAKIQLEQAERAESNIRGQVSRDRFKTSVTAVMALRKIAKRTAKTGNGANNGKRAKTGKQANIGNGANNGKQSNNNSKKMKNIGNGANNGKQANIGNGANNNSKKMKNIGNGANNGKQANIGNGANNVQHNMPPGWKELYGNHYLSNGSKWSFYSDKYWKNLEKKT